jgi:hypothetical protein
MAEAIGVAATTDTAVTTVAAVTMGVAEITDAEVTATLAADSQAVVLAVGMHAAASVDLPEAVVAADLRAAAVAAGFMATRAADSMAVEDSTVADLTAVAVSTEAVEATAAGTGNRSRR